MRNLLMIIIGMLTIANLIPPGDILAQRNDAIKELIQNHYMHTVLKPGDIPAIFNPSFISIDQSDKYYYPDEPLLIVVDEDSAKAYSAWHLDHHEVVNDYINGKAITVTW